MLLGPSQSRHTKPLKGFGKFKDCIFLKKKEEKKGIYIHITRQVRYNFATSFPTVMADGRSCKCQQKHA